MNKKALPYFAIIVLAIIVFFVKNCDLGSRNKNTTSEVKQQRGLIRNPSNINYSKHAKCRMECRHIDESEVKEVISNGTINYRKSDLQKSDCSKRYAIEGYSKDRQHLRIIAVPCANELTIVTCIDLDKDWECHCEGDE